MSSVIDLLKSHRSIRKFTGKAIDPEILNDIFLAGQAAATSSFLQVSTTVSYTHLTLPTNREV